MDFVYAPEGAKERRWRWAPRKMKLAETELVEELTGDMFWEWVNNVVAGSMRAAHVLIYLRMRDEIPDLDYDTIEFSPADIGWDLDDEEIGAAMRRLEEQAETEPLSDEDQGRLAAFRERLGVEVPKESTVDLGDVTSLDLPQPESDQDDQPSLVSASLIGAGASSGPSPTS